MRMIVASICTLLVVGACSALPGALDSPSTPQASQNAVPAGSAAFSIPTSPAHSSTSSSEATAACAAFLSDIPMVVVNSGEVMLAAAHEVTGAQLAAFLEDVGKQNGAGGTVTTWRDQPTNPVDVCIFDGDFLTMTPGPPGHDNSAVRVLVTVAGGQAQLWAIARKDRSAIPTSDPAASSQ